MCVFHNIGQMLSKAHTLGYNYTINENGDSVSFDNAFGAFTLACFRGSTNIAESCNVWISPEYRGKGQGSQQHLDRLEIAKTAGINQLVATVDDENLPEIKILTKNAWKKLHPIKSNFTENKINLWIKDL